MECPKCGYVRQAHDRTPDGECPRCGLRFSAGGPRIAVGQFDHVVVTPVKPEQTAAVYEEARPARLTMCADCGGKVSRLAVTCPHCGRPSGSGRVAVEVMNVRMEFAEMIVFMVKATLAMIPAAFILAGIGLLAVILFGYLGR